MSAAAVRKNAFGAVAEFGSAGELYHAAEKVRDAGYRFWDVHSPFPIHGMNKAMGLLRALEIAESQLSGLLPPASPV